MESSLALIRLRALGAATEAQIADADREFDAIWNCYDIWELYGEVCELARVVAPATSLRSLDALHLATFQPARRRLAGLELLSADEKRRVTVGA